MSGIALVLVTGVLLGKVARKLRQPPVIGEILAGIVLGPSLLGLLPGRLSARLFPAEARPYLAMIAQVGLLLFMFAIGWEFEVRLLQRRRHRAAAVSLSSIALAFTMGVGLAVLLYARHSEVRGHHVAFLPFALFLGVAMSITAFPVLARILVDNGLISTPIGTLALASAAIDDVLAWCLLALVAAIATAGGPGDLVRTAGFAAVYVAAMALLVRPLLRALVHRLTRDRVSPYLPIVLSAGVFVSSYATTQIGIHAIFGAFAFGIIMPREPAEALRAHVKPPLEHVSMVLLPIFFIVTGLSVDIGSVTGRGYLEMLAIVLVACAGKLLGAAVPAKLSGMSWQDARTVGILMNTRGLTELIVLSVGASLGILDGQMFTMMVMMALITTALAGPLLPRVRQHATADQSADAAQPTDELVASQADA